MGRELTIGLNQGPATAEGQQAIAEGALVDPVVDQPADRPAGPPGRRPVPILAVVTFGLSLLVLLFWWAACYPGRFSLDSLDYM